MTSDLAKRALGFIETCEDPRRLRQMAENAREHGEDEVRHTALLRLYAVMPAEQPGTLEHDVWQSIYALEGALSGERGKTTLLARTRQKIARDGELKTVTDLVFGKPSDGFWMLLDRHMSERTFEALALRHPEKFDASVRRAAAQRLREAGVEPPNFDVPQT